MSTPKKSTKSKAPAAKTPTTINDDVVKHIATIKPEAEYFVDGNAVPRWILDTKLFVNRVNPNGTVVIALEDSYAEIGTLLPKDVVITDEVVQRIDDIEVNDSVLDIRIFGVPSRMDNIKLNQQRLGIPDDKIFIDENKEGCVATAKRAWLAPADKPYVLVLQDDVELCDNFLYYANKIVKTQGDAIYSLFALQFSRRGNINKFPKSPYVTTKESSGQGIIMPAAWVEECTNAWKDTINGDDTNINAWAHENDKTIITTLPALLQHIGVKSVFAPGRVIGGTDFFRKNLTPYDWDNKTLNNWMSFMR